MSDLHLNIILTAKDLASNTIKNVLGGGAGGLAAGAVLGIAGGLAAIGIESVKMAGAYEASMNKVQALTGTSSKDMQWFSDQIMKLAPQLGQAPKEMMDGLYNVESALSSTGASNADMLNVLKLSAEAAATGMTDTKTITDGLTNALNAFHIPASEAGNAMDQLTQIVVQGKMQWPDFSRALGTISVGAHNAGITLSEAGSALADFTNQGMSTQHASTALSMLFMSLSTKTDNLAKNFDKLYGGGSGGKTKAWNETITQTEKLNGHMYTVTEHIHHAAQKWSSEGVPAFDKAAFSSMNLADKIKYLNEITSKHGETHQQQQSELLKIFGGNSRVLTSYNMLAQSMGVYHQNLQKITGAAQHGKTTTDAFAITQKGFNEKLKEAHAAFDVLLIKIGEQLLPVLGDLMTRYVLPLIQHFTDWVTHSTDLHNIMQNISDVIGGMLGFLGTLVTDTGNFINWLQQGNPLADTLKGILFTIAGIVAGMKISQMVTDLGNLATKAMDFATNAGPKLLNTLLGTNGLVGAQQAVEDSAGKAALAIGGEGTAASTTGTEASAAATEIGTTGGMTGALLAAAPAIMGLTFAASMLVQQIDNLKLPGGNMTLGQANAAAKNVNPLIPGPFGNWGDNPLTNPNPNINSEQLPSWMLNPRPNIHAHGYASGGPVLSTGLAMVHAGEYVIPAGQSGRGHTFNITVNALSQDPYAVAQVVKQQIADLLRSQAVLPTISSGGRL